MTLFPDQGILAGTGPAADSGKTFFCTFQVTESDPGFRPGAERFVRAQANGLLWNNRCELPTDDHRDTSGRNPAMSRFSTLYTGGNRHKQLTFKIGRFGADALPSGPG